MAHHKQFPKTFCTTREAAELLGVSLRTAQLWSESGLLEGWKTGGGHRRITRQSIERLLVFPVANGPAGTAVAPTGGHTAATAEAPDGFTILVVEDDPDLRKLYAIKLAAWPLRPTVDVVADGYQALLRIGDSKPDLLILDLQMPGMDGFRMLQTIGRERELASMGVVVVSGLDAEEIAVRGGVPEGIPILSKPVPFERLRGIAEQSLAVRARRGPEGLD